MKSALFIVPRVSTAWKGNEAGWITASGWAAAAKELWGEAWLGTRDGVFPPEESRLFPRVGRLSAHRRPRWSRLVPEALVTAYKDYQLWASRPVHWPIEERNWWEGKQVQMIWERHDLFAGPGRRLANRLNVPLVTSVEAIVVWEAEKWGVRRPLYGPMLERHEGALLRRSDLVVCVSEKVREKVVRLGVPADRTMVTPNRVDSTLFHAGVSHEAIRRQYHLEGKWVIGWTGSFRKFHGLPSVIEAFGQVHRKNPDTVLMLVGDGQELQPIRMLVEASGLGHAVVFTGRQPFTSIPSFVSAFDIGLVTAASENDFHYSPLKLREYLALGKAIIAPGVGDLPRLFRPGNDLLFYRAGDVADLAACMLRILENPILKGQLEANALQLFREEGTWVHELRRVCARLGIPVDETGNSEKKLHG